MKTPDLLGLPFDALAAYLDGVGVGRVHAGRVFRALHLHQQPLVEVADLGPRHAATLRAHAHQAHLATEAVHTSADGTRKLVLSLADGARVEAVLIPTRSDRTTLCLSTQVGCAMACSFCATGTLGLARHLTPGEIVGQVHEARRLLAAESGRVDRLVFMGMGEPLHNYAATRDALRVLMDDHGLCFGARSITVSTVGLPAGLQRLAADFRGRVNLALSLHAGTDATRARIIPLARHVPLARLKAELLAWPLPANRVLMLEVVVLPGVNDADEELAGIAEFASGLRATVNLLCFNPFPDAPFRSPTRAEVLGVRDRLMALGTHTTVRWPRGREASGACGQLALAQPPKSTASSGSSASSRA